MSITQSDPPAPLKFILLLFVSSIQWVGLRVGVLKLIWHGARIRDAPVIRITTQIDEARTLLTIAGQLTDLDIKEVRRVRNSLRGEVVLNLRGVDACSEGGIRMFREWLDSGARLAAATPFLEMILKDAPPTEPGRGKERIT
jgi:hypothetical protein